MPSFDRRRQAARAQALAATRTLLATLAMLSSLPVARAVPPLLPNLLFNVTLSSMSPLWDYSDAPAWSTNFSNSDPAAVGTVGRGHSVAWVAGSGEGDETSMFLCQQGTALYVYGSVSVAPGQSEADKVLYWAGEEPYTYIPAMAGDPNTLLYKQEDSWRWFCSALYARPNMGLWSINGVTITTGMETDAPTFADVNYETVPFVAYGELNRRFTFYGAWEVSSKLGDTDYESATGTLTAVQPKVATGWIPDNTSFVVVRCVMGPGYDKINIHLNPKPGPPYENTDNYLNRNTSSEWYMPDAVLYFRPIDPTVQYRLSLALSPNSPANTTIGLHSVTYYSALWNGTYGGNTPGIQDFQQREGIFNSINTRTPNNDTGGNSSSDPSTDVDEQTGANNGNSSGKSTTNIGAVAGGVVGGVAVIILLAVALFFWRRRKRSRKGKSLHGSENSGMFEVDSDVPPPHPFVAFASPPMPTRPDLASPAQDTHTVDGSEKRALAHAEAAALVSPLIVGSQTTLHSPTAASPAAPVPNTLPSPPTDLLSPAVHAPQLQTPRPRHTARPELPTRKPTVRAVDGGAAQDVEIVPPLYDPSWLGGPARD